MATVRDIAKKAGVSISTVSRVLNDYHGINDDTRQKVQAVINELGYQYVDRSINESDIQAVGIVMPLETGSDIMTHPTIYSILTGLSRKLNEMGIRYSVLMIDRASDQDFANIVRPDIDAYVLLGTSQTDEDEIIARVLKNKIPILVVNRWLNNKRVSYVNIDDVQASYLMTEYLIHSGHRKIGMVNGDPTFRNSQMRFEGFSRAMNKYELPINDCWLFDGTYVEETGRQAALAIDQLTDRPTALFASSDIIALGLQKVFQKLGYHLPEDMSISGFGDVEFASYLHPSLTTIRIPTLEMGIQTAEILRMLLQVKTIRYIKMALEAELIIRESVVPISGEQPRKGVK